MKKTEKRINVSMAYFIRGKNKRKSEHPYKTQVQEQA